MTQGKSIPGLKRAISRPVEAERFLCSRMNLIKASLKKHKVTIGETEINVMAYYLHFHLLWHDLVLVEINGAPF